MFARYSYRDFNMRASSDKGLLATVPVAPPDLILGTAAAFKADTNPLKVNLGVGAYRSEEGQPFIFTAVREAEIALANDPKADKEYLPIDGLADLKELTQQLLFGHDSPPVFEKRVASVQALSGTGGLRLVADFVKHFLPQCGVVYVSKPSWLNHKNIFGAGAGLEICEYPYWDQATRSVAFDQMLEVLSNAPEFSVIILHACAHNPTGMDLTGDQWDEVQRVCALRRLVPVLDSAYQGFASGDLDGDAFSIRLFASKFPLPFFVTQSFAKNLGLYGERIGMVHVVCQSSSEVEAVLSQLRVIARRTYSSPPIHGARLLEAVLKCPIKMKLWKDELRSVAGRIRDMRRLLREGLEKKGTPGTWHHITDQIGMFSYTGLTSEQCERLTSKWHIYLLKSGRISMAGLNHQNIDYVVDCIDEVVRSLPCNRL